ncbi:MAG: patatin-like phospholipase family protein, partial [Pirellulales bacterium]
LCAAVGARTFWMRCRARWLAAAGCLLLTACTALRTENAPLAHYDPDYGYRAGTSVRARALGDVLLLLAFSGGGTRAAALSYGVLQELRNTTVVAHGRQVRLLDEVDIITSVSGGSFTAAYYGLFGERIFADYESRFLRRNVQGAMVRALFNPLNWFNLVSSFFDRTDLAIEFYNAEIFDQKTFADLETADGPFLEINAADLAAGNRFTFFQPQFDLICSDLSSLHVGVAVAASSAVPGVFSSIVLRNYAPRCGFQPPAWFSQALAGRKESLRRYRTARIAQSYVDGKRKYIHLVDGGVADNLGLRGPIDSVMLAGGLRERFEHLGIAAPRYIVIIVVNAEVHPEPEFTTSPISPALLPTLDAVSGIQIYSYNFETLELMHDSLNNWTKDLPPDSQGRRVESFVVELAFDSIADDEEREFFHNIPTSFTLPDETVDLLIAMGGRLLRESPDYQRFLASLGGT